MHLSGRGITHLDNFEFFPNIKVIYLNDNRLKRITGLELMLRIKEFYAENNLIESL